MTRRYLALTFVVLATVAPAPAQSRAAKPDPISGTWTGQLIPSGAPRGRAITLALIYDGKSKVSGTIDGLPNPGDVKSGSFDARTGALTLQLGKSGNSAVLLRFEGTVEKKSAAGRVTGEMTGEFKLTKK